jgi:hypothetical protein
VNYDPSGRKPPAFQHLSGGRTSVPSIGSVDVSLAVALDRIASAEAALENARSIARQAAKREGKSCSGLFAKSIFILRDTATRWCDEAREEGRCEGRAESRRGFERAIEIMAESRSVSKRSPFEHLFA